VQVVDAGEAIVEGRAEGLDFRGAEVETENRVCGRSAPER
jgi:hypothetical protein